jgi:ligand-binding sensor domain-containing protein
MVLLVKKSLAICLLLSAFSARNELKFENILIDEGLSESVVQAIVQANTGFIWLGTAGRELNHYSTLTGQLLDYWSI